MKKKAQEKVLCFFYANRCLPEWVCRSFSVCPAFFHTGEQAETYAENPKTYAGLGRDRFCFYSGGSLLPTCKFSKNAGEADRVAFPIGKFFCGGTYVVHEMPDLSAVDCFFSSRSP